MRRSPFPSNQLLGDVRGSGWSITGLHNFGGAPKSYAGRSRKTIVTMSKKHFPSGWDGEQGPTSVLDHYETQSDEDSRSQDDAAFELFVRLRDYLHGTPCTTHTVGQPVLDHYETQSDEEAVAEDEAAFESTTHTAVEVPVDLVPEVRELIAKHKVS